MTNVQKQQVIDTVPAYLKSKGIGYRELAVKAGISYTMLKSMMRMDLSIENKFWKKVWNVVNTDILSGVFQTSDCTSVFELCNNAIRNKRMIGLTGDTGMGKSTACQAFAVKVNVFYYYIDATVSPKVFLHGLLKDMGIYFDGNLHQLLNRAADELNVLADPLLILDECGKLSDKMILTLHSLRDKTMLNCGMVLAGMPEFKNKLIKLVNRGTTGYSEFFRRINMWHELKGLSSDEIVHILESNGITDKEEQREFRKCSRFGDLMNGINLHKTINN